MNIEMSTKLAKQSQIKYSHLKRKYKNNMPDKQQQYFGVTVVSKYNYVRIIFRVVFCLLKSTTSLCLAMFALLSKQIYIHLISSYVNIKAYYVCVVMKMYHTLDVLVGCVSGFNFCVNINTYVN